MDFARNLCGVWEEHNPFSFEHEREGYKRHADCVLVGGGGHRDIVLKFHGWIPHGKTADVYFFPNYIPL